MRFAILSFAPRGACHISTKKAAAELLIIQARISAGGSVGPTILRNGGATYIKLGEELG